MAEVLEEIVSEEDPMKRRDCLAAVAARTMLGAAHAEKPPLRIAVSSRRHAAVLGELA